MSDTRTVIVRASGFYEGNDAATNLGDAAQQIRAIRLLREILPKHEIAVLANSLKSRPLMDCPNIRTELPMFLGAKPVGLLAQMVQGAKLAWLLVNACLMRIVGRTVGLGKEGKKVIDELSRSDLLFFAGSGTLNQKYLNGVGGLWLLTALLARIMKIPTILVGQQIGPFKDTLLNRRIVGLALGNAMFVGCRDEESLAVARTVGIKSGAIHYTGDEGGYLCPASEQEARSVLANLGYEPGYVAVHIRLDNNSHFAEWMDWYAAIVNEVAQSLGAPVLLVPMAYRGPGDDRRAMDQLMPLLNCRTAILDCEDPSLVKACLASAAVGIGVANHFVVFAASVGVPTIGIYSTEYMRQKLEGAEKRFSHVKAVPVGQECPGEIARLAIENARDKEACSGGKSFDPDLPPDYWDWLGSLAEIGISVRKAGLRGTNEIR